MRRLISGWLFTGSVIALCGCQSWSQIGQGVPGGSRVPPPGTGTYSVPSSYYNNGAGARPGAVSSNSQTTASGSTEARTASAQALPTNGPGVSTANWQVPSVDQLRSGINNRAAAALDGASSRANQVVQAGTARAATEVEKVAAPILTSGADLSGNPASRSLNDNTSTTANAKLPEDEPQLNWQPPQ